MAKKSPNAFGVNRTKVSRKAKEKKHSSMTSFQNAVSEKSSCRAWMAFMRSLDSGAVSGHFSILLAQQGLEVTHFDPL